MARFFPSCFRAAAIAVFGLLLASPRAATSRVFPPADPFDPPFPAVNRYGAIDYKVPLGSLPVGRYGTVPVEFVFAPARRISSPLIGDDWQFPLAESKAFPVSEDAYEVQFPWSQRVRLYRRQSSPSELRDDIGLWTGREDAQGLTVSDADGVSLVYEKGKLVSLHLGDDQNWTWKLRESGLDLEDAKGHLLLRCGLNSAGFLVALQFEGAAPINVKADDKGLISFTSKDGTTKFEQKSRIPAHSGTGAVPNSLQNLVVRQDSSSDPRVLTWNSGSGDIVSDSGESGLWSYEVRKKMREAPADSEFGFSSVSIARRGSDGSSELMETDWAAGSQLTESSKGGGLKKYFFTAFGPKFGKIYRVDEFNQDAKPRTIYRASFDYRGLLLEQEDGAGRLKNAYDKRGRLLSKTRNGTVVLERRYQADGILEEKLVLPSGVSLFVRYADSEAFVTVNRKDGSKSEYKAPAAKARQTLQTLYENI